MIPEKGDIIGAAVLQSPVRVVDEVLAIGQPGVVNSHLQGV